MRRHAPLPAIAALLAWCCWAGAAAAQEKPSGLSAAELARLAQNPIANLISVPFQNNTAFNVGPLEKTQNVLNIQPVIPISITPGWNVITRTIVPLISQPAFEPGQDRLFGLGDVQFSAFLSPSAADGWIWGVGAIAQLPTNSNADRLGNERWGLGPTAVVLHLDHGDPWVYGALVNNVWSVTGSDRSPRYSQALFQPFLNYNLPGGTYLTTGPEITANWDASGDDVWTVPLGGGIGHIFHLGRLPVNAQLQGYYNVIRPDDAADWIVRFQLQFMLPKSLL